MLILVLTLNLIALIAVTRLLPYEPLFRPLLLGFVPGSLPIGTVLAFVLIEAGDRRITVLPIDDDRFLRVAAHLRFEAAVEAQSSSPERFSESTVESEQQPPVRGRADPSRQVRPRRATRWGS